MSCCHRHPRREEEKATGTQTIETQVFIAESEPVLRSAGQNLSPALPTKVVTDRVKVTGVTDDVIQIDAKGTTAQQSMRLANAVAEVYLVFITTDQNLPGDLGKKTGARVLEQATTARGGNLAVHLGIWGLLGALVGAVAGSIGVLAKVRGDRRLRLRDEIADAVGLPVLASVSSYHATDDVRLDLSARTLRTDGGRGVEPAQDAAPPRPGRARAAHPSR